MENNKLSAILARGCSASGKSTWAQEFVANNPSYVEINRDNIRLSLYGRENMFKGDENHVTECQHSAIIEAHSLGQNIVISDTNLNSGLANRLITFLTDLGYTVSWKDFTDVPLETLLERDSQREFPVGEAVIRRQYRKYIMKKEFKEREPYLKPQNQSLPKAVISDIDGTVADMRKGNTLARSPFDWHRVGEDSPKIPILGIIKIYHDLGYKIIFLSGRDESCRDITSNWLVDNLGFDDFSLYMRPHKNSEKDSIIKERLFNENIKDKFFIEFVLDDRDQVVDLWRKKLGLTCLQVDYGNF